MKLIVGLGNPGKKYARTRHNIGFKILDVLRDTLAREYQISDWNLSKKFNAEGCGVTIADQKIILAKPMTYMNGSGQAVQLIAGFYKTVPQDIIVVHDDKDLILGEIRDQFDRGHAGHNGVRSITESIGTNAFGRLRVGVGDEKHNTKQDTATFVLSNFGLWERKKANDVVKRCVTELLRKIS